MNEQDSALKVEKRSTIMLYIITFIGCLLQSRPGNQKCSKRLISQLCISMKNSTPEQQSLPPHISPGGEMPPA